MTLKVSELLINITPFSIFLRLFFATVCGGLLGFERGRKKRPAGLRTYMIVCIGAAVTMLTNQYVYETFGTSDPVRMGAQVISGIGFLGAGTIIVTGKNKVKGLTTAAGLWAAGCIGLAIGIGFYLGALFSCLFIFFAINIMHRIDIYISSISKVIELYIEFESNSNISYFLQKIKEHDLKVTNIDMKKPQIPKRKVVCGVFTIRSFKKLEHPKIISIISNLDGIVYIEEL